MKKILGVLILSLAISTIFGQSRKTDSLRVLLKNVKTDTARVMILRDLCVAFKENLQFDSASDIVKQGLALAYRIKYKRGIAALLNSKSGILSFYGNEPESLKLCLEALAINEEIGDYDGISYNLNNVGISYIIVGNYRSAIPYFFKAMEAREKGDMLNQKKSSTLRLSSLVSITQCYLALKMFDSAKFYTQKLYDEGLSEKDNAKICYGLGYLGGINDATGENKIALEYYRSSQPYGKLSGNIPLELWSAMARLFNKTGETDSAMYYARQTMAAMLQAKSPGGIASMGKFLSKLHKKLNHLDSSLYYLEMATDANDSLIARQQKSQVANALFNQKLKEEEKEEEALKAKEERKRNLQYAAIALATVIFIISFFLFSHSVHANQRLIKFLGILGLLIVFEFINLFIHPYLDKLTNHSVPMMLVIMVGIAALLIPLHHKLEHWITHRLVEKNKMIRLAAAKKTIAKLEGEQTN
ncbi:MAG TPA: tetratricopeptide repeat protein [Chitinophagaceae bacterium]|nr:tetratricopeptide repeat protein [Chitinophagaceae bacterium]